MDLINGMQDRLMSRSTKMRSLYQLKVYAVVVAIVVIARVDSQVTDQAEVDRPVPVEKVYVMAGDRVELACDVSTTTVAPDSSDYQQHERTDPGAPMSSRRTTLSSRLPGQHRRHGPETELELERHRLARSRRYRPNVDDSAFPVHSQEALDQELHLHHPAVTADGGYLVLWFIEPDRKPFYSLDVRRGRSGSHWRNEQRFGRRVSFLPSSKTSSSSSSRGQVARLCIVNVTRQDGGDYRCRVDFNNAPSRNFKYRLIVIEPPTSVVVLDGFLQQLTSTAGPLEEGNDLILTCKAYGGYPQPWVTWWQGGQLLDNTTDARSPESVSNLLVVPRVGRQHLHDAFTCQVTSSLHLPPTMKTVTLELHLRPIFVEIKLPFASSGQKPLVAGQSLEVKCRTGGSRPTPSITWWKGNKQIPPHLSTVTNSADGNLTESRLILTPSSEDDASHLICRVKNSMIPVAGVVEDSVKLDVHYPPEVGIALGSNINGDDIKEGDDLYIECHIRANPSFHKLQWTHNGVPLVHNVSAGVVLSNVSLVLRSVTHSRAGLYACSAANTRGETASQPGLRLRIQYAPRCRSVSAAGTVSGVSKQETASLDCQVDADPSNDVHFWWTFLGTPLKSNGSMLVTSSSEPTLLSRTHFTTRGTTSVLQYSPKSELDFGVVACWASNPVGNQREPCLFHVVPAGKPAAPSNCAIHNQTADSVRVDCQEAFDGGLQQTFGLELVDRNTRTLRYVFNNTKPVFTVYGLEPETAFLLNIYALNAKGRSQPITLETTTLRAAQKHTGHALYFQMTPLLGVLVGTAATLLVIVMAVAVVVYRRNRLKRQRQLYNQSGAEQQTTSTGAGSTGRHHHNGPNQPLLPLPHSLPNNNPSATGAGNAVNGPADYDGHQRAVFLNKSTTPAAANGHHPTHHFGKLNSPSNSGGGGIHSQQQQQQQQQDPDIILRDMDLQFQPKRMLPAVMVMSNPPSTSTLPRRGLKKCADDADSSTYRSTESSARGQLQSPLSLSSRSSTGWNIPTNNLHWTASGHQSPSLGLFNNNGALMQQHNLAADLLADCRLPESSL